MKYISGTIGQRHRELLRSIRKEKVFIKYINDRIPREISEKIEYSLHTYRDYSFNMELRSLPGSKETTIQIIDFLFSLPLKWSIEKVFIKDGGFFKYVADRTSGSSRYTITFYDLDNIDRCKIIEKTRTVVFYETDCKG